MRNPGWAGTAAGAALIAVTLAVTACRAGSVSSAEPTATAPRLGHPGRAGRIGHLLVNYMAERERFTERWHGAIRDWPGP